MNKSVLTIAVIVGGIVIYYLSRNQGVPSDSLTLTLTARLPDEPIQAAGSLIVKSPNKSSYSPGDLVYLTAHPPAGTYFNGWYVDGVFYGGGTLTNLLMLSDHVILADFVWGG